MVKLDVLERPEQKAAMENPGAADVLAELGGARSGIPFFAILNEQGKKLADSNALPGGQNIGFPAKPEEVAAFRKILEQTAPHLTADQITRLIGYVQEPVKKDQ